MVCLLPLPVGLLAPVLLSATVGTPGVLLFLLDALLLPVVRLVPGSHSCFTRVPCSRFCRTTSRAYKTLGPAHHHMSTTLSMLASHAGIVAVNMFVSLLQCIFLLRKEAHSLLAAGCMGLNGWVMRTPSGPSRRFMTPQALPAGLGCAGAAVICTVSSSTGQALPSTAGTRVFCCQKPPLQHSRLHAAWVGVVTWLGRR